MARANELMIEDLLYHQFQYAVDKIDFANNASSSFASLVSCSVNVKGMAFIIAVPSGPRSTMIRSRRPVVSICATRTGAGKSPAARKVDEWFRAAGRQVAVIRHPMPYGDLAAQAAQRFASLEDLDRAACTIEEREEYEPHIVNIIRV